MTEQWEQEGMTEVEWEADQEESQWAAWEKADTDVPFETWRHDMLCDAWDMREGK